MAANFLILHGFSNHRPVGHWQHWLAAELADRGHRVLYPPLPDPDHPELAAWLATLADQLATLPDGAEPAAERVVLCHSLSSVLWMHAAARGTIDPVDRMVLVAPPSDDTLRGIDEVAAFAGPGATAAQLAATSRRQIRFVASDDDPYHPGESPESYGRKLGLDVDTIEGAAHLDLDAGYGSWPSMLAWCLDPGVRISARADH